MKSVKTIGLCVMALGLAGLVAAVSPQLFASQAPGTDASGTAGTTQVSPEAKGDLVDSYNWKTTAGQTPKKL